ncbi:MAG: hypothetical protein ACLVL2_29845 [Bacteroides cellulosilyticus]
MFTASYPDGKKEIRVIRVIRVSKMQHSAASNSAFVRLIPRRPRTPFTAKLSFTSKRLQRSDKFFAGKKSQIGQNWFNLEISKVYIIFVQHKIIPNGPFHTHQKHQ